VSSAMITHACRARLFWLVCGYQST
jgi:hypothetical protein